MAKKAKSWASTAAVTSHFRKAKKPAPPTTSWWAAPGSFSDAAHARDTEMRWSAEGRSRELRRELEALAQKVDA
jgi:hypothetical protein